MDIVPVCCTEKRVELKGKVINLPVHLHPNSHLWSQAVVTDRMNEVVDTSGGIKLPL